MRIQKSICDQCGKEIPTDVSLSSNGFSIRIGNEMAISYLHDADFCSIECLALSFDRVLKQINKKLNDAKKNKLVKD